MLIQLADALLDGGDHRAHVGFNDAVEILRHLALDLLHLGLEALPFRLARREPEVPQLAEHRARPLEELRRGLKLTQQRRELALDLFAADRLAVARAGAVVAQIVVVIGVPPLRLAGRERRATIATGDEAAKRKSLIEVFTLGRAGVAVHALQDFLVCLEADQRLVLALAERHAPGCVLDISCVEHALEDFGDLVTALRARIFRLVLQEALDFGLKLEAARGVALQRLGDNRGQRLVPYQHPPAAFALAVFVTDRGLEDPEAALKASLHFLEDLPAVLLALQLTLRSDDGLDEFAFRRVLEFEVQAFARRSVHRELRAQANVKLSIARKALEIVEDDDIAFALVGAQILEQRHHAGAAHEVAPGGFHIVKDRLDGVAARGGIFAAAVLLAVQPVALAVLFPVGNPAVDDGFLLALSGHGSTSFPSGALLALKAGAHS